MTLFELEAALVHIVRKSGSNDGMCVEVSMWRHCSTPTKIEPTFSLWVNTPTGIRLESPNPEHLLKLARDKFLAVEPGEQDIEIGTEERT